MPSPFEILRQLQQPTNKVAKPPMQFGGMNNPSADLYDFNSQMVDEVDERMWNAQVGGGIPGEMGRLEGIRNKFAGGMANSPIARQAEQVNQFEADNYNAAAGGFGALNAGSEYAQGSTPLQSREIYRRKMEQEKMRQPIQQEHIKQAGDLAQQQEISRGNLAVAQTSADVKSELADLLFNQGAGGNRRMSISGIGSVGGEAPFDSPPNGAYENLQQARLNYENALRVDQGRWNPWAAKTAPERKASLDSAVMGYVGQHPAANHIKNFALQIYRDPKLQEQATRDIIATISQRMPDVDQDDLFTLQEILETIRNK